MSLLKWITCLFCAIWRLIIIKILRIRKWFNFFVREFLRERRLEIASFLFFLLEANIFYNYLNYFRSVRTFIYSWKKEDALNFKWGVFELFVACHEGARKKTSGVRIYRLFIYWKSLMEHVQYLDNNLISFKYSSQRIVLERHVLKESPSKSEWKAELLTWIYGAGVLEAYRRKSK